MTKAEEQELRPAKSLDRVGVGETGDSAIAALLASLPDSERDRLFPLLADGPAVVEHLMGRRPHKSLLFRHARDGICGEKLRTVTAGRTMLCCARWLIQHWEAVDSARRVAAETIPTPRRAQRRRVRRARAESK